MRAGARAVALAAAGLTGLLLAGCALPDGVDGDLTDGWGAMAEPVGFVPAAGACHPYEYQESGTLVAYRPVDCDESHVTETVHVGELTGEAAGRTTPPPTGSPEWREAYAECDEAAAAYLGANFRYGQLWLGVTVPSEAAWEGGARWFRCDVLQSSIDGGSDFTREGSLAGVLDGDSDLVLGCVTVVRDDAENIERMEPVACDEPHHAEFVGVWVAPDVPYLDDEDESSRERVHRGCREQVAEYVDVPVDGNLPFRTGTLATWMEEVEWDNGDRGFRCYLWLNDEEITGSLAGAGTSGLPIQTG